MAPDKTSTKSGNDRPRDGNKRFNDKTEPAKASGGAKAIDKDSRSASGSTGGNGTSSGNAGNGTKAATGKSPGSNSDAQRSKGC